MTPAEFMSLLTVEAGIDTLRPLLFFTLGMVAYSIFVFHFYQFLSRREIIRLDLAQYSRSSHPGLRRFLAVIMYFIEYLLLFPLFIFFWFGVIAVLLAFLSREEHVTQILLVAMALVAAVRVTAYYHETLSADLAKMLPFALLGVLLVDIGYFSLEHSLSIITDIPNHGIILAYYLIFTIGLEWILRITNLFVRGIADDS